MKYSAWIRDWFDNYVIPFSKAKTIACYKSIITNHIVPLLGEYELEEVNSLLIQRVTTELLKNGSVKADRGLSAKSVNLIITIIQSSLTTASEQGLIATEQIGKIRRPKAKEQRIQSFSLKEQRLIEESIIKSKNPKLFGIVLCLYTGLRIGELLALEWNDIDFHKLELSVTKSCADGIMKNGKYGRITDTPKTDTSIRIVPLPKQLVPFLKEIKKTNRSPYVVGRGELVISVRAYQRSFEALLNRLGIRHRGFHSLRHTFATRALENGMDIKTLAEILGHKNATVTLSIYAHSFMDHKKQMMNRLGSLLGQSFSI